MRLGCLCVCVGWIKVVCIRNCVVDGGVSSYMLVIPDGLHYIDVGWKPMQLFMAVHIFNYSNQDAEAGRSQVLRSACVP